MGASGTKKALVFLAEGFEEVEAITPIDYLRRAGIEVTVCGVEAEEVSGSHGIRVRADTSLANLGKNAEAFDALICPGGGPGSQRLYESGEVGRILKEGANSGKIVAAICAAPAVVFFPLGLLEGRNWTCYPGMEERTDKAGWLAERVVQDGTLITSRGAGTADLFAKALIAAILDKGKSDEIASSVLMRP
jgi:4-methyl-5(b-hydroxyethyl)-thiazole monophosphate biosynthesis